MRISGLLSAICTALLSSFCMEGVAQERLVELTHTKRVQRSEHENTREGLEQREFTKEEDRGEQLRAGQTLLTLPFFDDFSESGIAEERWENLQAWQNNSFAVSPPSAGVATFDALNSNGQLHPQQPLPSWGADTLTSRPINLAVPDLDDIWLSFWYQPQGLGNAPEKHDSLLVDFFDPVAGQWHNVWQATGDTLHPFREVMLPVLGEKYLQEGFRFRFRNRVSLISEYFNAGLRGNTDHWHVDYIRLEKGRSATDTTSRDVAVVAGPGSLLTHYHELPYTHFQVAFLSESTNELSISYRNLWHTPLLTGRRFSIRNMWDPQQEATLYSGGNDNALPAIETHYTGAIDAPYVQEAADSARYLIKGWIETFGGDPKINDTLKLEQTFGSRFARDDGWAEAGYGIEESAGSVGLSFRAFVPDSINTVEIWLNATAANSTEEVRFRPAIWADNNGKPGALLYAATSEVTLHPESRYHAIPLEKTVQVNGIFYVGWIQDHADFVNVGFDRNSPREGTLFYRLGSGGWRDSDLDHTGIAMIRPLAKRSSTPVSPPASITENPLFVSPNPAAQMLTLTPPQPGVTITDVQLLDGSGRQVYRAEKTDLQETTRNREAVKLSLPLLPNGPYLLRIRTSNGKQVVKRIVIAQP
ncbi:MAG: T9SS type A sorting domain-containing protein [Bacteroidales bacterium]